jgi:hypothetical protein
MKAYLLILIFCICFSQCEYFAQKAFPHANGNTWYYSIADHGQPPTYFSFEIIGDTLMPNGKLFWIFEPYDMFYERYIRSDSLNIYYWDTENDSEKIIFDFDADTSYIINWANYFDIYLTGSYETTLFGRLTDFYSFNLGGLVFGEIRISDIFGYEHYSDLGDAGSVIGIEWSLKGCLISDTLYGKMTNIDSDVKILHQFKLSQNYPNPFNPLTKLDIVIPYEDNIELLIFNSLGQLIERISKERLSAGKYSFYWDATNYPSGVYYYRLETSKYVETKKCILLK